MEGTLARNIEPKRPPQGYALSDASIRHSGDTAPLAAATLVAMLEEALHAARNILVALQANSGIRAVGLSAARDCSCDAPTTIVGGCASDDTLELDDPAKLTRRETEVLGLLAAGRNNHSIARALCLSPRTVQRHVANVYSKIGAHNRAEATAYAMRHGIV